VVEALAPSRHGQSNSESVARIQIACSCGGGEDSDDFDGGNPNVTKDRGVITPQDDCRRND